VNQRPEIDKNWCFCTSLSHFSAFHSSVVKVPVRNGRFACYEQLFCFQSFASVAVVSHTRWCLSSVFLLSFSLALDIRVVASVAALRQPEPLFLQAKIPTTRSSLEEVISQWGGGEPAIPEEPLYRGTPDVNRQEHDSFGEDDCLVTTALIVCHRNFALSRPFCPPPNSTRRELSQLNDSCFSAANYIFAGYNETAKGLSDFQTFNSIWDTVICLPSLT